MTDQETEIDGTDEAELLLPWYVSGNLEKADRLRVEAWLDRNPEAHAHLARAREEMDVTYAASEAMGTPSRAGFDRLMAEVERTAVKPASSRSPGWVERVWSMLSPRYALAGVGALCLLVLAQGTAITIMSQSGTGSNFEVATGAAPTAAGPTALVAFTEGTTLAELSETLGADGLAIVDGPRAGGIYVIGAPDTDEGAAALAALAQSDLVTFHSPQAQGE